MIYLNPGERITDESKFVATNEAYSKHLKGYARQVHQEKLERFKQLKNDAKDNLEIQNKNAGYSDT